MKRTLLAPQNVRMALAGMHQHVTELNGRTAASDLAGLKEKFDLMCKTLLPPPKSAAEERQAWETARVEMCGLIDQARDGDREARTELNALRSETIDLYVRATSNFLSFFEQVDLEPNEQAEFTHTYRNEVKIRYIGQDGGVKTSAAVKAQKQVFVDMRELTTDAIGYQIRDINLGTDIAAMSQATVDLSFDLANKVDLDCFTLVNKSLGAFVTTGTALSRTFIPNSRINQALLPTTNQWNIAVGGAQANTYERIGVTTPELSIFRLAVCRAAMNYCESWGNIFNGPVRPTGTIFVPSSEATNLSNEIQPTGATYNPIADQIMQNFTNFDYMGVHWVLVPDVTLTPGLCYVVLNRPLGRAFFKPKFDEEVVETDRRKNWETRSQSKPFATYVAEPWRPFVLQIQYH